MQSHEFTAGTNQAEYLPLDLATAGLLSNDLFCSFIALIKC